MAYVILKLLVLGLTIFLRHVSVGGNQISKPLAYAIEDGSIFSTGKYILHKHYHI